MNAKNILLTIYFIGLFLLTSSGLFAKNYGVFVDGGFSGGEESEMDRLIDQRLEEASNQMGRIDPQSERQTVDSKEEFLEALRNIECNCGDEINVVMMGHGTNNRFVFSKGSGGEHTITADELREALEGAADTCCCKINVVIFSCHSGSMIDELMEGQHIHSVFTSCASDERSYSSAFWEDESTFRQEGDWMNGFNEDLASVPRGTSFGEANEIASRSAREKIPNDFLGRQTPQGWMRGNHQVRAHVEGRPSGSGNNRRVRVTYYEPEWLRGKTGYIYIGNNEYPNGLTHCKWISGTAIFEGPQDNVTFGGEVTETDPPTETILAHIEGTGRRSMNVHIALPQWQFCRTVRLNFENLEQIAGQQFYRCTWIRQPVSVDDPACGEDADSFNEDGTGRSDDGDDVSTDEPIRPYTPTFRVKVHIEGYNPRTGELHIRLLNSISQEGENLPNWLGRYAEYRRIFIPPDQRGRLNGVRPCNNIWIDLTLPANPEDTPTGSNIRRVHRDQVNGYSVDVSLKDIVKPKMSLVSTITPKISLTNVGEETVSFPVDAFIVSSKDIDQINCLINDELIAESRAVKYSDRQFVEDLEPGQTIDVEFSPCPVKRSTDYIIGVRAKLESDEVPENDTISLKFNFEPEKSIQPSDQLLIAAKGTGKTTGHVATLSVTNPTNEPVYTVFGPFFIPSWNGRQGYIVPQSEDVSVQPGQTVSVPLTGFCTDINLPPAGETDSLPGIEGWVTPQNMGPLPVPNDPDLDTTIYKPNPPKPEDEIVLTYPGTEIPFPYRIDLDSFPEVAAPLLFDAIVRIEEAYISLLDEGLINTPFSRNRLRESETVIQQLFWRYAESLTGTPYHKEEFTGKLEEQFQQATGIPIEDAPKVQQDQLEQGAGQFWDTFELIGERAKILNPADQASDNGTTWETNLSLDFIEKSYGALNENRSDFSDENILINFDNEKVYLVCIKENNKGDKKQTLLKLNPEKKNWKKPTQSEMVKERTMICGLHTILNCPPQICKVSLGLPKCCIPDDIFE